MIFTPLSLKGTFVVDIEPIHDERGSFARTFCRNEFQEKDLASTFVQSSVSVNTARGTLRGMHYQRAPHPEIKLVRCTAGAIFDVIIDLRFDSPTFKQWTGVELTAQNCRSIYIPGGIAHGFLTLADNSEVLYQMSEFYHPECAAGVRYDDPAFAIEWPYPVRIISRRDTQYEDFLS